MELNVNTMSSNSLFSPMLYVVILNMKIWPSFWKNYTSEIDNIRVKVVYTRCKLFSLCIQKNVRKMRTSKRKNMRWRKRKVWIAQPLITTNVQQLTRDRTRGAISEDGVNSQLPPWRSFLYNLLLQVHESWTFVGKQSPQIDHRKLIKASNR